jgi:hypothetical protein
MTSFVRGTAAAGAILCLILGVVLAQGQRPAPVPKPIIPYLVPGQTGSRENRDFYEFSWQEFYALNWPAEAPKRGVPDTSKTVGDLGVPRVWETWKTDYELFPPQPSTGVVTPTPWESWEVAVPICKAAPGLKLLPFVAKGESVIPGGVNQAMGGPLVDQNGQYVRYEVRENRSEYDETVSKAWFLRKNLTAYPQPANLFHASTPDTYGPIELKAAWRIMTEQERQANPPRYYMSEAQVVDPKTGKCSDKTVTVGLIGFHIAHKTDVFQAWVWSTFEQVDNVPADGAPDPSRKYSLNDGKLLPKPSIPLATWGFLPGDAYKPVDAHSLKVPPVTPVQTIRLTPIRDEIKTLNDQVHQVAGIKGTVWENYELVETQWQTAEDLYAQLAAFPEDAVANVTMETFFQGFKGKDPDPARNRIGIPTFGTSCLHCHYQAAQFDFSWMLADQAWPNSPGSEGTTRALESHRKSK